ncbi:MAG: hypothetical protein GXO01_06675 [Epsilonproteobacteria bacterium]|nr:hypothetical protein [Campylobacterota bacterium]
MRFFIYFLIAGSLFVITEYGYNMVLILRYLTGYIDCSYLLDKYPKISGIYRYYETKPCKEPFWELAANFLVLVFIIMFDILFWKLLRKKNS